MAKNGKYNSNWLKDSSQGILNLWTEEAMESTQLYFDLEGNCPSSRQSQVKKS